MAQPMTVVIMVVLVTIAIIIIVIEGIAWKEKELDLNKKLLK